MTELFAFLGCWQDNPALQKGRIAGWYSLFASQRKKGGGGDLESAKAAFGQPRQLLLQESGIGCRVQAGDVGQLLVVEGDLCLPDRAISSDPVGR